MGDDGEGWGDPKPRLQQIGVILLAVVTMGMAVRAQQQNYIKLIDIQCKEGGSPYRS